MSARQETEPCWIIACDDCGDNLGSDDYGCTHHVSLAAAEEDARENDWSAESGKWFCWRCAEKRSCETHGHIPDTADPTYCTRCGGTIEATK